MKSLPRPWYLLKGTATAAHTAGDLRAVRGVSPVPVHGHAKAVGMVTERLLGIVVRTDYVLHDKAARRQWMYDKREQTKGQEWTKW